MFVTLSTPHPIIILLDVHSRTAIYTYLLKVDNADEADEAESHQEEIGRRRKIKIAFEPL